MSPQLLRRPDSSASDAKDKPTKRPGVESTQRLPVVLENLNIAGGHGRYFHPLFSPPATEHPSSHPSRAKEPQ